MKKMTIKKFWQWFLTNKEAIATCACTCNCESWSDEMSYYLYRYLGEEEVDDVYIEYNARKDKYVVEVRFNGSDRGATKLQLLFANAPSLDEWCFPVYQPSKEPSKKRLTAAESIDPYDCWFFPDEVTIDRGVTRIRIYAVELKKYLKCFPSEVSRLLREVAGKGNYENGKLRYKVVALSELADAQKRKLVNLVHWHTYIKKAHL